MFGPSFAIYNSAGEILRTVSCPEEEIEMQLQEGESYLFCDAQPHDRIDVQTLQVIRQKAPAPVDNEPQYSKARRQLYPPVEEQLDMLYKAVAQGLPLNKSEWFSRIKNVKTAIPTDSFDLGPDHETLVRTAKEIAPTVIYHVEPTDKEGDE